MKKLLLFLTVMVVVFKSEIQATEVEPNVDCLRYPVQQMGYDQRF